MRYGNVELHNVWDIIGDDGGDGFGISRLPRAVLEEINKGARGMARMGAGCEIRGMLAEGGSARIVMKVVDSNVVPPVVSVFHGPFRGQAVLIGDQPTEIVVNYPATMPGMLRAAGVGKSAFDPRLVRVRLPSIHPVRILSIDGDLTYPVPGSTPGKTLLCYGSSITHGAHAIPPESTYAAQCARRLGCDLVNLGVGGSARMERAVAEHIAARTDWDFAVFEMGINVRQWPREEFQAAVETFVGTVAAAHPDKFIFCIDLFTYSNDFEENPATGIGFRDTVKEIAATFDSGKIVHIDGRTILTDPAGLCKDLVHPSDDGMHDMGANLAGVIAGHLFPGAI